jgi:hypothetical protein
LINGEQSIKEVRAEILSHLKAKLELWDRLNHFYIHCYY